MVVFCCSPSTFLCEKPSASPLTLGSLSSGEDPPSWLSSSTLDVVFRLPCALTILKIPPAMMPPTIAPRTSPGKPPSKAPPTTKAPNKITLATLAAITRLLSLGSAGGVLSPVVSFSSTIFSRIGNLTISSSGIGSGTTTRSGEGWVFNDFLFLLLRI